MRWTRLDGAWMGFDRDRGLNLLYADEQTRTLARRAPRTLQVGLLTPCNMACSFCYRDAAAPSRLTREFVVDLLIEAERWGLLEVAFGGGEPLLFKGFADLIDELHRRTELGLNLTTNGLLLTPELMARLRGKIGEIRLSAYPDNDWRGTLTRFAGEPIGINWIVTPANVGVLAPRVREMLALGARNVLLLGYKGEDTSMLLGAELAALRAALAELDGLPLMVDICLYPHLADLPHLFARTDCGAGDDMLAITADRAVQACSFADHRIPFETFEELQLIYGLMRAARPHAHTGGCTRDQFAGDESQRVVSGRVLPPAGGGDGSGLWAWQAHASSNSGPYTLLARFATEEQARRLEDELDDAYQAHLDWVVENGDDFMARYYAPTPPLRELAARYGFEWPEDRGFAWEGDSFGDRAEADLLEIERFGTNLIIHNPYAQGIGEAAIEHICAEIGAESVVSIEVPFRVVARPRSEAAEAKLTAKLEAALAEIDAEYVAFDSANPPEENEVSLGECDYRVEIELSGGARRLGFASTIGGQIDSARLVLAMSRVKDVEFQLRGGQAPRRIGTPWSAADYEPLDPPGN